MAMGGSTRSLQSWVRWKAPTKTKHYAAITQPDGVCKLPCPSHYPTNQRKFDKMYDHHRVTAHKM